MEKLLLGSTPCNESCAQVGQPDYEVVARAECAAFAAQLKRAYESATGKQLISKLVIQGQSHDFGTYFEVVLKFESEQFFEFEWFDQHTPTDWDEEAMAELGIVQN